MAPTTPQGTPPRPPHNPPTTTGLPMGSPMVPPQRHQPHGSVEPRPQTQMALHHYTHLAPPRPGRGRHSLQHVPTRQNGQARAPLLSAPPLLPHTGAPNPNPHRPMVPRRVTLISVSCVRAWPHFIGGIQTCWPWVCLRARQSTRSTMASWRPLPGVVRSWRALTVSLVQSSCRRYQPRGLLRALTWRVAWRRLGSRMVAGVRGGAPGPGGVGWVGCRGLAHLRRRMVGPGWTQPGWAVPGVLEACGWRWGACAGRGVG